jgi:hypothetical protein
MRKVFDYIQSEYDVKRGVLVKIVPCPQAYPLRLTVCVPDRFLIDVAPLGMHAGCFTNIKKEAEPTPDIQYSQRASLWWAPRVHKLHHLSELSSKPLLQGILGVQ